ncbi:MAG: ATP-binding protein [Patulibacter sp.]
MLTAAEAAKAQVPLRPHGANGHSRVARWLAATFRGALVVAIVGTVAVAVAIAAGSDPAYVANVVQIIGTSALFVGAFTLRRQRMLSSAAGYFLAGAWLLYLVGLGSWNFAWVTGLSATRPRVWDVCFIAAIPLMIGATVAMPFRGQGVAPGFRLLCDGLVLGGGLLMLTWGLWVNEVLHPDQWSVEYTIGATQTVLNYLLLGVGIMALTRGTREARPLLASLTIAYATLAVAGIFEVAAGFDRMGFDARWLYLPFTGVGIPLLAAAVLTTRSHSALELDPQPNGWPSLLLPPFVAAVGLAALFLTAEPSHGFPSFIVAAIVVALVAREVIAFAERHAAQRESVHEILRAEARERQRFADELHDELLQDLIVLRWRVEDVAEAEDPTRHDAVFAVLDRCQRHIRLLLADMHPASPESSDLRGAMTRLVERLSMRTDVPIDVEVQPDGRRPVDAVLEAVARELLANAIKHAHAASISLRITQLDNRLRLTVTDDGIGPGGREPVREPGHIGLASCTMRVTAAGGTLSLLPRAGGGTTATVTVPVDANLEPTHR